MPKVARVALQNASSVASLLLTIEALIIDKTKDVKKKCGCDLCDCDD